MHSSSVDDDTAGKQLIPAFKLQYIPYHTGFDFDYGRIITLINSNTEITISGESVGELLEKDE